MLLSVSSFDFSPSFFFVIFYYFFLFSPHFAPPPSLLLLPNWPFQQREISPGVLQFQLLKPIPYLPLLWEHLRKVRPPSFCNTGQKLQGLIKMKEWKSACLQVFLSLSPFCEKSRDLWEKILPIHGLCVLRGKGKMQDCYGEQTWQITLSKNLEFPKSFFHLICPRI